MENKEITREEFDRFAAWWDSKREYAKQIAKTLCERTIHDIFLSDDTPPKRIGYTYYEYDDDHFHSTGYFPASYLFDSDSIEKAKEQRAEEKRQEAIRLEQQRLEDGRKELERARAEYEYLKAKFEKE